MRFVRRARNHRRSFGRGKKFGNRGGGRRRGRKFGAAGMRGRSGIRVGYRM